MPQQQLNQSAALNTTGSFPNTIAAIAKRLISDLPNPDLALEARDNLQKERYERLMKLYDLLVMAAGFDSKTSQAISNALRKDLNLILSDEDPIYQDHFPNTTIAIARELLLKEDESDGPALVEFGRAMFKHLDSIDVNGIESILEAMRKDLAGILPEVIIDVKQESPVTTPAPAKESKRAPQQKDKQNKGNPTILRESVEVPQNILANALEKAFYQAGIKEGKEYPTDDKSKEVIRFFPFLYAAEAHLGKDATAEQITELAEKLMDNEAVRIFFAELLETELKRSKVPNAPRKTKSLYAHVKNTMKPRQERRWEKYWRK